MGVRVDTARRQLPRLSIDPNPVDYPPPAYCASPSSSSSSARVSLATSWDTTSSSPGTFHVICLYDFTAQDDDQLSFKKGEVLDIVKQEDSVCDVLPIVRLGIDPYTHTDYSDRLGFLF